MNWRRRGNSHILFFVSLMPWVDCVEVLAGASFECRCKLREMDDKEEFGVWYSLKLGTAPGGCVGGTAVVSMCRREILLHLETYSRIFKSQVSYSMRNLWPRRIIFSRVS